MNIYSIYKMPFSTKAVWPELVRVDSIIARIFWLLVVPLSLLPPAMLYLAGSHYGDAFFEGFSSKPWGHIALVFFIGEIASVTLMGWVIKHVARAWGAQVSFRNAYRLAAIAPIPLWVSSLGLLVASLAFNVALTILALALSCALIFQGVRSFCQISEEEDIVQAADITRIVFGVGLLVWAFFMSLPIIFSV